MKRSVLPDNELAYLAGLFDGEGSFSIQVSIKSDMARGRERAWFNPRMTMTLKYGNEVLEDLVSALGGKVYGSCRDGHRRWSLGKKAGLTVATNALLPYLRIKREIGERFLEALAIFPDRAGVSMKSGERIWSEKAVLDVARIALTLNQGGKPAKRTLDFLDELEMAHKT